MEVEAHGYDCVVANKFVQVQGMNAEEFVANVRMRLFFLVHFKATFEKPPTACCVC